MQTFVLFCQDTVKYNFSLFSTIEDHGYNIKLLHDTKPKKEMYKVEQRRIGKPMLDIVKSSRIN